MSQQMRNGYGFDFPVPVGQSMLVSSITGTYTATIVAGPGKGTALATDSTGGGTYGPYSGGVVIRLQAGANSLIDYDIAVSPVLTYAGPLNAGYNSSGDVASAVDKDGNVVAFPRILGQGVDISGSRTVTGTTSETSVYSLTIPGGAMGASGALRVSTLMSMTNNANVKTMRIKFGNAAPLTLTATPASVLTNTSQAVIQNMGSATSQEAHGSIVTSFGSSTAALATGANDTSVDQLLEITLQLAVGTDTASLRRVVVELMCP